MSDYANTAAFTSVDTALRESRQVARSMGYDNVFVVMFRETADGGVVWARKVAGFASMTRHLGMLELMKHDLVGGDE